MKKTSIFSIIVCTCSILFCQNNHFMQRNQIIIDDATIDLFKAENNIPMIIPIFGKIDFSEKDLAKAQIEKSLLAAFDETINAYGNGNAISDSNIRSALNTLINAIKNKTRFITIKFAFDKKSISSAAGYYDWYISRFAIKDESGWTIGHNMKLLNMIKNHDIHGWREPSSDVIQIFNGIEDFSYRGIEATDPNSGCKHESINYHLYSGAKPIIEGWNWASEKNFKLASAIFHEMVHIALQDAGIARYLDEATIEDIVLRVFPKSAGGFNAYEMGYYIQLWNYKYALNFNKITNESSLPFFMDINKIFIYKDRLNRGFNPPVELKYERWDNIGVIVYDGRSETENVNCDDAKSVPLKAYIIPYRTCCK